MDNSFKSLIDTSKSVLILLPTKPYFDQVAAGLAIYLALKEIKEVQISCPTPMTVEFNRLIGVNKISQELGSKNLIIRFTDYRADDIERVSYDIESGQFRLSVIPKPKINAPAKEQVELSYSGVSADCVILVGGANDTHFPALSGADLASAKLVHIGIRDLSLAKQGSFISLAKPASSISELAVSTLRDAGLTIEQDIATNLLMGLEDETKGFASPLVSAETFATVSELMRMGGKRTQPQPAISDFPPGAIPGAGGQQFPMARPAMPMPQSNLPKQGGFQNDSVEEPPQEWLQQPKVFKGTSV